MLLSLEDSLVRARVSRLSGNRLRLTLDYPCDPQYRDRVMTALADLLRPVPSPEQSHEGRAAAKDRE